MSSLPSPGPELVREVRAGFVLKGTTLGRWCREHNLVVQHARMALVGEWNGPKGRAVRHRVLQAAGLVKAEAA